jgi:GTPase SAR1 family protein
MFSNWLAPDLTKTETINGEPVYRIFVLGTRQSGKTVFLSALFGHLRVQNQINQFAVEPTLPADKKLLQQYYDRISNPEMPWPAGSVSSKEFEFKCVRRVEGAAKDIPLFRIKYHDYPGAYLTDTEAYRDDQLDIEQETQRAHSILVLIDGYKIFERLEGYPPAGETLESDLHAIIPLLERSARKPIHFLVTKWDILKGLHSFASVKSALLECESFSNFVENRRESCVRLIPVSAVGNDFVKFDLSTRTMTKIKGKAIRPYNVDLSIVLTLMDQIFALGRSAVAIKKIPYWIVTGLRRGTFFSRMLLGTINLGDLDIQFGPLKIRTAKILRMFAMAEQHLLSTETKIQKGIARARDQTSAFQAILQAQALRMLRFIREYPESKLTGAAETWLPNTGPS